MPAPDATNADAYRLAVLHAEKGTRKVGKSYTLEDGVWTAPKIYTPTFWRPYRTPVLQSPQAVYEALRPLLDKPVALTMAHRTTAPDFNVSDKGERAPKGYTRKTSTPHFVDNVEYEPTFDQAPTGLLILDCDNHEVKGDTPAKRMAFLREQMPPEFRRAGCVWHASNSHGHKPNLAKAHLIFVLSEPLFPWTAREFACETGVVFDSKMDVVAQLLFWQNPTHRGAPDPVGERLGVLPGDPMVIIPEPVKAKDGPRVKSLRRPPNPSMPANVERGLRYFVNATCDRTRGDKRPKDGNRRNTLDGIAQDGAQGALDFDVTETLALAYLDPCAETESAAAKALRDHGDLDPEGNARRLRKAGESIAGEWLDMDPVAEWSGRAEAAYARGAWGNFRGERRGQDDGADFGIPDLNEGDQPDEGVEELEGAVALATASPESLEAAPVGILSKHFLKAEKRGDKVVLLETARLIKDRADRELAAPRKTELSVTARAKIERASAGYGRVVEELEDGIPVAETLAAALEHVRPFARAAVENLANDNERAAEGSAKAKDKRPKSDGGAYEMFSVSYALETQAERNAQTHLIENLIVPESLVRIVAKPGARKTFFALDLMATIATGTPLLIGEEKLAVEKGPVLYFGLEGGADVHDRVHALSLKYDGLSVNPFFRYVLDSALLANGDADRIIATAKLLEAEAGRPVTLIVVDTLAEASAGYDENAGKDMGLVLADLQRIKRETGAAVGLIGHLGKDTSKGGRGWSGIKGALETDLELELLEDGSTRIKVEKQRTIERLRDFTMTTEARYLRTDKKGRRVHSLTVKHYAYAESRNKALSETQVSILAAVTALYAETKALIPRNLIVERSGLVPHAVRDGLAALVDAGQVVRPERGKYAPKPIPIEPDDDFGTPDAEED